MLHFVEVETRPNPDASIIWLHGLGADGHDFKPIIPELNLADDLGIRFIFPHAPKHSITVNGGLLMPAWYDIISHDVDRRVDVNQLLASAAEVAKFVDNEMQRGLAGERIIIAGFSQGGAVALQLALSFPKRLGGIMALSSYFATRDTIEFHPANREVEIFIGHGLYDSVVPERLGRKLNRTLQEADYPTSYNTYPMNHSVCEEEIRDISRWLQARLR